MKQEDRVRQTKQAFRMALLHFLQEKPINKVTIADLTGFTGYNRSTFYLYYHDIYELKDDLEHTVFEEIHARMVRHPLEEMKESIVPLIYDMFDYADQNREVFHTLSNNKSYRELTDGVYALLRDFCYSSWDQVFPGADKEKYDLYFHFISSGDRQLSALTMHHDRRVLFKPQITQPLTLQHDRRRTFITIT